jgi:2-hydroxy-6-oxonona-2,4-dienedioate hydrolase
MERAVPLCIGLPGSQLHVFNDCGHWPQWEYPDEFNGLISQFAETCARGRAVG